MWWNLWIAIFLLYFLHPSFPHTILFLLSNMHYKIVFFVIWYLWSRKTIYQMFNTPSSLFMQGHKNIILTTILRCFIFFFLDFARKMSENKYFRIAERKLPILWGYKSFWNDLDISIENSFTVQMKLNPEFYQIHKINFIMHFKTCIFQNINSWCFSIFSSFLKYIF